MMKLHQTKGIVLRTVKYGETSVIVTIFTELFGIQSYLINGVRTSTARSGSKLSFFQPASLLEMVVYHNELKQLNRVREYKWTYLYNSLSSDVVKNGIAMFIIELLSRCLKQPEPNAELFQFTEDCLIEIDRSDIQSSANFPLFYALHATNFFGVPPVNISAAVARSPEIYFDLKEGNFSSVRPDHPQFLENRLAVITAELLKARKWVELSGVKLNQDSRRALLEAYEQYYHLHIPDFRPLKSIRILREIIG